MQALPGFLHLKALPEIELPLATTFPFPRFKTHLARFHFWYKKNMHPSVDTHKEWQSSSVPSNGSIGLPRFDPKYAVPQAKQSYKVFGRRKRIRNTFIILTEFLKGLIFLFSWVAISHDLKLTVVASFISDCNIEQRR